MANETQNFRHAGLGAIFDLGFTKFITLNALRVLYVLGLLLIVLVWAGSMLSALAMIVNGEILAALATWLVATIGALLYVIFYRVWLELIVVLFRIGENTSLLVQQRNGLANDERGPGSAAE